MSPGVRAGAAFLLAGLAACAPSGRTLPPAPPAPSATVQPFSTSRSATLRLVIPRKGTQDKRVAYVSSATTYVRVAVNAVNYDFSVATCTVCLLTVPLPPAVNATISVTLYPGAPASGSPLAFGTVANVTTTAGAANVTVPVVLGGIPAYVNASLVTGFTIAGGITQYRQLSLIAIDAGGSAIVSPGSFVDAATGTTSTPLTVAIPYTPPGVYLLAAQPFAGTIGTYGTSPITLNSPSDLAYVAYNSGSTSTSGLLLQVTSNALTLGPGGSGSSAYPAQPGRSIGIGFDIASFDANPNAYRFGSGAIAGTIADFAGLPSTLNIDPGSSGPGNGFVALSQNGPDAYLSFLGDGHNTLTYSCKVASNATPMHVAIDGPTGAILVTYHDSGTTYVEQLTAGSLNTSATPCVPATVLSAYSYPANSYDAVAGDGSSWYAVRLTSSPSNNSLDTGSLGAGGVTNTTQVPCLVVASCSSLVGLAAPRPGSVYYAGAGSPQVGLWTPGSAATETTVSGGTIAAATADPAEGLYYVAQPSSGFNACRLASVGLDCFTTTLPKFSSFTSPPAGAALAAGPDGTLWFTLGAAGTPTRFTELFTNGQGAHNRPGATTYPYNLYGGIAVDARGTVYSRDIGGGWVGFP